jgi:type II secretory pathway pseudopilin PulG
LGRRSAAPAAPAAAAPGAPGRPGARSARPRPARALGGFTLVEVVVTLGIALIVLGVTLVMLVASMGISGRIVRDAQGEQVADACLDLVADRLLLAGAVAPSPHDLAGALAGSEDLLYVGDASGQPSARGWLYLRARQTAPTPENAFGEQFYLGQTLSLDVTQTLAVGRRPALTIELGLYDPYGVAVAHRRRSIVLVNADALALKDAASAGSTPFPPDTILTITPPR